MTRIQLNWRLQELPGYDCAFTLLGTLVTQYQEPESPRDLVKISLLSKWYWAQKFAKIDIFRVLL